MVKTKRVALSLTVSDSAAHALRARAAKEGHRYPLAFAAALLERAIDAPSTTGAGPDWVSELRTFARFHGVNVSVDGDRVTLNLSKDTTEQTRYRFAGVVQDNYPPPAGVVFAVKIAGSA